MTCARHGLTGAVLVLLAACTSGPAPEPTGDPVSGRAVAQDLCASCHAIEAADVSPNPDAPPLRSVLARRDAAQLTTDLESARHIAFMRMPQFFLGDGSAQNLVAYIESLQAAQDD